MISSYSNTCLEHKDNEYVFTANVELKVKIKFPSKLLKLIPLCADTLEERGSLESRRSWRSRLVLI